MKNITYSQQVEEAVRIGAKPSTSLNSNLEAANTSFSIGMDHEEQAAQLGFDSQNDLNSNRKLTPFKNVSQQAVSL